MSRTNISPGSHRWFSCVGVKNHKISPYVSGIRRFHSLGPPVLGSHFRLESSHTRLVVKVTFSRCLVAVFKK